MPATVTDYKAVIEGHATYSASVFAHAPAATPTDFFTVLGSAATVVRITRIWAAGRATAATWFRISLRKYSTAFSGGTAVAVTLVPHDSADPAPTAVVNTWSGGLPTVGTLVGAIHDDDVPLNALTMTATQPFEGPPELLYDFTRPWARPIVLRGATQYAALNGAGAALPGGTVLDIKVEFTEE